jgi:archaellum component FlaG (FlaF/FlaG flagellin family)
MRRLYSVLFVIVLLIAAFAAGGRATTRTYQFTGVVKAVAGDALTVEKSAKETWQFEIAKDTKGATPKAGDRVTVNYKMVTTEIAMNPGGSPAAKKK